MNQLRWLLAFPEKKLLLLAAVIFILVVVLLSYSPARAHDTIHPDRNEWMMALENSAGVSCCSVTDDNSVKDVQWDIWRDDKGSSHYKIFIEGIWVKVDDSKIVKEPNKFGVPIAWLDRDYGVVSVKCFLPGSGL
jgi:hypothetical protein